MSNPIVSRPKNHTKNESDYHNVAALIDSYWIGESFPSNVMVKTMWACKHGHTWEAPYNRVQQKHGCPYCGGVAPKTEQDYHDIAIRRGFKWIGTLPENRNSHTVWECQSGHVWSASYRSLTRNGCPICSRKLPKTPADYAEVAISRGFTLTGGIPSSVSENTSWRCNKCGFEWNASYANLNTRKSGCPKCSKRNQKSVVDYQVIASKTGLVWVGIDTPAKVTIATQWKCKLGHIFLRSYNSVDSGNHGCPYCQDRVNGALVSTQQREIALMVNGEINRPLRKYRIDVAIARNQHPIAIEYDCWYWHQNKDEKKRDAFLVSQGWWIIHILAGVEIPTLEQIESSISMLSDSTPIGYITLDWR